MPVSVADTRFMCSSFAGIKRRAAAGAALNAFDYKLIRKRSFHGWQLEFPGAKIPALKRKARFCAEHHRTNGVVGLRPPSRRVGPARLAQQAAGATGHLRLHAVSAWWPSLSFY